MMKCYGDDDGRWWEGERASVLVVGRLMSGRGGSPGCSQVGMVTLPTGNITPITNHKGPCPHC